MASLLVKDRRDVIICREQFAYTAFPSVTRLQNGEYLVGFNQSCRRERHMHPPTDPRYMNLISRSRDHGETWEAPRAAPGYEWTGVECPSLTQISSGEVLLIHWRMKFYPLETARKLVREGTADCEIWVLDPETRYWRPPQTDADWDRSPLPWARGYLGCFVHISRDNGATWDETVKIDTSPYIRGYSPRPPTELADGTLLLALGSELGTGPIAPLMPGGEAKPAYPVYVVHSSDRGRSWGRPVVAATPEPPWHFVGEPTILALPSGKIIVMSREQPTYELHQCDSYDGGVTWTPVRNTGIWGCPAHLVLLRDGRILCIYGHRRPPFGIRACLSDDEGQTWDYANELIIRDDLKNTNLGYPTAVEEDDGRIFAAYYGEDEEGVTCVMGSHFRLPR